MKTLLYTMGIVGVLASALVSCLDNQADKTDKTPDLNGVWHYQKTSQTVYGADGDTLYWHIAQNKDTIQFYEKYSADSILDFYVCQRDSLINHKRFHYIIRNDTIFVENDDMKSFVHILEVTDSMMHIDYTRTPKDTTYYLQAWSRKSELPKAVRE